MRDAASDTSFSGSKSGLRPDTWSRANAAETQPGYVSYLSREREGQPDEIHSAISDIVRCFGVKEVPAGRQFKAYHYGYAYYNMTAVAETLGALPGLSSDVIFRSIGFAEGQSPPMSPLSLVRLLPGLPRVLALLAEQSRRGVALMDRAHALANRVRRGPLPADPKKLDALAIDVQAMAAQVMHTHIITTLSTFALFGMLQKLCEQAEPGAEYALTGGLSAMSSKELGLQLWKLAEAARSSEEVVAWIVSPSADAQAHLRESKEAEPYRKAYAAFIDAVGDRTSDEMDLAVPRWEESPALVTRMVASYLQSGRDPSQLFAEQEKARAAATIRVEGKLSPLLRPLFRTLLDPTQRFLVLRENLRTSWMKCLSAERRVYLKIADHFVAQGILDRASDLFFLKKSEVTQWIEGSQAPAAIASQIAARKAEQARAEGLCMPEVLRGAPPPMEALSSPPAVEAKPRLKGVGASPGVITGRARVIHHASQEARLERGDILIAPTTDPGWTPLFVMAEGLVMERGGLLSHGVIVAREYGIPAVVGVKDALRLIPDGAKIKLDGNRGEITLI